MSRAAHTAHHTVHHAAARLGTSAEPAEPRKFYYRIGEVASLLGVETHVLRYWEREFRSVRPTKSARGQRVYSRRDVEELQRVRALLYEDGFTIAGAKKQMQSESAHGHQTKSLEAHRRELTDLRDELKQFLAELDP